MGSTALRAHPIPNAKILRFRVLVVAAMAQLRGREERVYDTYFSPIPFGFVFELPAKLKKRSVSYCSGKMVILHHSLGFQALNANHIVLANQVSCGFIDVP